MRLTIDQRHYNAYINSSQWAAKRREALEHHGHYCHACGTTSDLHVHHRTYQRLGREHINDLIPLCQTCHQGAHTLADTGLTIEDATNRVLASQPAQPPQQAQPHTVTGRLRGLPIIDRTGKPIPQQRQLKTRPKRQSTPTKPKHQHQRHGTPTMYDNGCRCPACQDANNFRTNHPHHYKRLGKPA